MDSIDNHTLMWIGPREECEFRAAYAYCETRASQIAWRANIDSALARPALGVAYVVLTRQQRQAVSLDSLQVLRSTYPSATFIELMGSLCAGERPRPLDGCFDDSFYWHQANQRLGQWIAGGEHEPQFDNANSVAVVAETIDIADPLMELATSVGAAAVWCRRPGNSLARNFDVIWWDDSIASPATTTLWRRRIDSVTQSSKIKPRQAWITHSPTFESTRAAQQAGIDVVISKPYRIDVLMNTICNELPGTKQVATLKRLAA